MAGNAKLLFTTFNPNALMPDDLQVEYREALNNYDAGINLYPNPTTQFISIDIPGINPLLVTEMRIFNVNGQVMYQGEVRNNMDVSDYPAGYYFLQVGNQHVKFIKR